MSGRKQVVLLFLVAGFLGTAILAWRSLRRHHSEPELSASPPSIHEITNVVNEIMSIGEFSRSPEPNHALTKLAYIRAMEGGNALWEMDLLKGATRALPRKEKARRLFDWSPDDRYLPLRDWDDDQGLTLYDGASRTFRRALAESHSDEAQVKWLYTAGQLVWLDTNRFAYIASGDRSAELRLAALDGRQAVLKAVSPPAARDLLVRMSGQTIGFVSHHELWTFDVSTLQATQITTNGSKQFWWLNYSKENEALLYCSEDSSDWRHLFRISVRPGTLGQVTQLTFGPEHTYNGQWIQHGTGFAYVGSLTNHFYLAVRPKNVNDTTNLFFGGYLYGYRVSADGAKIFAVASVAAEPCSLWEYDIGGRRLRCLVPGQDKPFVVSSIIAEKERWQRSADGLRIPYFLLEPRNFNAKLKYPLVVSIPHKDGMFEPYWEKYRQFFGNIGVLHVAVNPRGSDGYGRSFREDHPEQAEEDILAVCRAMVNSGNVDARHVFLLAHSSGGDLAQKLANEHPDLWDGVILFGSTMSVPERRAKKSPRYFIFTGEKDPIELVTCAHEFERWAVANNVEVRALFEPSSFHFITDVNVDKKVGIALAEFIFRQKIASENAF